MARLAVSRSFLVAFPLLFPASAWCVTYTAVDLTAGPSYIDEQATAAAGGTQGGFATFGTGMNAAEHALLWTGSAEGYVDLTPTHHDPEGAAASADVFAVTPTVQAGQATFSTGQQAGYWTGTANSFTTLPTGGLNRPEVLGAADMAGGPVFVGDDQDSGQALEWTKGVGGYALTNLAAALPTGVYTQSLARGTDGVAAVGQVTTPDAFHAAAWDVATHAFTDLNGAFDGSDARAVAGNVIAGYADNGGLTHAVTWTFNGTGYDVTDLTPEIATESEAYATNATMQAGDVMADDGNFHAFVWSHGLDGTITGIDLQASLDPAEFTQSIATGIDADGDVVGVAFDTNGESHPILWTASVPEPASLGVIGVGSLLLAGRRRRRI